MQPLEVMWLGLATLATLATGCSEDGFVDDEVGGSTLGSDAGTDTTGSTTGSGTDDAMDATTGAADDATTDTNDTDDTNDTNDTDDTGDTGDTSDESPEPGNGDFELLEAAFADDFATLVLTFSAAVAPVEGVAPSDFRISAAITMAYEYDGMTYDYSYYCDPNVLVQPYNSAIAMVAIANGPDSNQISLTLDPVFDADACESLETMLGGLEPGAMMPEAHVFPHYAPGATPLTSKGGSELAAIGPDWVLEAMDSETVPTYGWPDLDPQIPIPCP
jgi:hypothetical protein